ncbi:enoyl-CoA hydratase/isomerase family protein [Geomicrobium sp. JSM 1781026]|uniref:enoyl-CoA hydratase/isomerase family protein n=1 Tax=Geomicrobium sp. JSM 1781026 TaxID=3344580 RepID=UPI0035C07ECB
MTLAQNTIRYEVAEKIATITLHRPHVKNALNNEMHTELFAAFKEADRDPQVAVIVLQGSEGAFSAGADLKSVPLENHDDFNYGHSLRDTYNRLILTIAGMNKPTIAYLNGIAVGAGLSIALACDFRVAAPEAKLALSFIRIGLVPDAGASYFLPRLVGQAKAMELALGGTISAEEAYRINLVNQMGTPDDFARQLTEVPITAYGMMKRNMKESFESSLPHVLEQEVTAQTVAGKTREHMAAIQQFIKK